MILTTVTVQGMMCAMCEAHIKTALLAELPITRARASHRQGTVILESHEALPEDAIREALAARGYQATGISAVPARTKRILRWWKP